MRIEITPAVVVPDVSPLVHLAAVDALSLLQEFGRVIVMDMVAFEASADLEKPWASEVAAWLRRDAGGLPPVAIVATEIGEAYRLARQADPRFRLRNAGESAIRDWLVETLPEIGGAALVVYEDEKVPKFIRRERMDRTCCHGDHPRIANFRAGARPHQVCGGHMERNRQSSAKREPSERRGQCRVRSERVNRSASLFCGRNIGPRGGASAGTRRDRTRCVRRDDRRRDCRCRRRRQSRSRVRSKRCARFTARTGRRMRRAASPPPPTPPSASPAATIPPPPPPSGPSPRHIARSAPECAPASAGSPILASSSASFAATASICPGKPSSAR